MGMGSVERHLSYSLVAAVWGLSGYKIFKNNVQIETG